MIHILDEPTINQIAAGEVVERPSAVVKELVENAIDAGASAITVEIKEGGLNLIRITDNGAGIEKADIPLAFLRHATSKIRSAMDLLSVTSLGFRGEALSSIAAVAQVELITKTPSSLNGYHYIIEGGVEKSIEEIGCPGGTTIIVRNLFYNTPARRKFLKSPVTETGYISDLMERLLVSHPEISFKFITNNQVKLQSSGNNNRKDILYHVYGRDIAKELLNVDYEAGQIKLCGFIGKPIITRGNRNFENYFINGRYIKSNVITKAIEEAYRPYLMQHKYPFTSLYIDIEPSSIDVNVHPQKLEIRLKNSDEVFRIIIDALRAALSGKELIPSVSLNKDKEVEQKKESALPEPFEENRRKQMLNHNSQFLKEKSEYQLMSETRTKSSGREDNFSTLTDHQNLSANYDTNTNHKNLYYNNLDINNSPANTSNFSKVNNNLISNSLFASNKTNNNLPTNSSFTSDMTNNNLPTNSSFTSDMTNNNLSTNSSFTSDITNNNLPTNNSVSSNLDNNSLTNNLINNTAINNIPSNYLSITNSVNLLHDDNDNSFQDNKLLSNNTSLSSNDNTTNINNDTLAQAHYSDEIRTPEQQSITKQEMIEQEMTEQVESGPRNSEMLNKTSISSESSKVTSEPLITGAKQLNLFQSSSNESDDTPFLSQKAVSDHRIIGQIFSSYWLVEYKKELFIIDQHAAHEKVLYEKLMKAAKEKSFLAQRLLPPIVVTLTLREQEILKKYENILNDVGYEFEPFGGNEYSIRAVPANLYGLSEKDLLLEFLDELTQELSTPAVNTTSVLEKIASLSCKAAIKANHTFSTEEAAALIKELLTLENPYHCPHGRPVIISMSKYEIEKKFKRII